MDDKILNLLCNGIVNIEGGLAIQKNQRSNLSQYNSDFSLGNKAIYLNREYYAANSFIEGAKSLLESTYLIDDIKYDSSQLYSLWIQLPDDKKESIAFETFRRYREMYEIRQNLRKPNVNVTEIREPLDSNNITSKLKRNISLNEKNDNQKATMLPDTDFLSKFSVGLIRYFVNEYLFRGKISDLQRTGNYNEVFNELRSIMDEDDDRFKKLMNKYKYSSEDELHL